MIEDIRKKQEEYKRNNAAVGGAKDAVKRGEIQ
jgi:hypothetical protein